jgi:hypothetical protein
MHGSLTDSRETSSVAIEITEHKKIPALRAALEGHFDAHHALWIGAILRHIDFLDEQIDRLSDAIEEQIRPLQARG